MAYDYKLLKVTKTHRLAEVLIDNPPINLITPQLYDELVRLTIELKRDTELSVVVFKSADPDFFLAHFDVSTITQIQIDRAAQHDSELSPFHSMCERVRSMNKVTIAQIEARVGGGGNEFVASMDMRFGVIDATIINQMEVPLGILPGGSGTQRLPRLVGRGRAMEIILGGEDIDAATAERWGYLNRIYPAAEIDAKVGALARRIASFPIEAVRLAKQSIDGAEQPLAQGLADEAYLFQRLLRTAGARERMTRFTEIGGQTRDGELRVAELGAQIAAEIKSEFKSEI